MGSEPFDLLPLWLFLLLAAGLLALAMEVGYRLGVKRHGQTTKEKDGAVGTIVGSLLALVAFMLAFTFGMGATRFDHRRLAVLQEANAIGTTYLRASFLAEPRRTEVKRQLREYVGLRLQLSSRKVSLEEGLPRCERLHEGLWANAAAAVEANPTPATALFAQSLNEVIDMHATRVLAGLRSRIPFAIWLCLISLSLLGMAAVGYQTGLAASERSHISLVLVLALAGVLYLIADLDREGSGMLAVSQQAMVDLQQSLDRDDLAGTPPSGTR